jgi:hypothetical protein
MVCGSIFRLPVRQPPVPNATPPDISNLDCMLIREHRHLERGWKYAGKEASSLHLEGIRTGIISR